jgi:hypothetical protein
MSCPSCGCAEIEVNEAGGDAVCTRCGRVLEENTIVSSIEFSENTAGALLCQYLDFLLLLTTRVSEIICGWLFQADPALSSVSLSAPRLDGRTGHEREAEVVAASLERAGR